MANKKVFESMDGNQAAAYTAYAFTEVAGIYPITPSSPMAEYVDEWASKGKKNLFGVPVKVIEMQSEAGAVASVHGSLQAGALTTTFTASQGLLLKIPNMYKIAGQLLPGVIHVAARSIAAQALSIFGDHQDVMAARQTGFAMLASGSVQEVMDLGGVAHLAAIKSSIPFLHFFDGFRTSHEIQKVEVMDYKVYDKLIDYQKVDSFRKRCLSPNHPVTRGSAQNDDVYFQTREAQNEYYLQVPDIVHNYMVEISKVTGRHYDLFTYYGASDATDVIVAMGSVCDTVEEVVDYLNKKGEKVGVLKVHLYRPFSVDYFKKALPETVKRIAVLDRTIEQGSTAEPLLLDVRNAFFNAPHAPKVVGGRYGLSSKDTTPGQIVAVFKNLKAKDGLERFTIGIVDDVTHLSLPVLEEPNTTPEGTSQLIFFGLGSDGTVGANKNTIKLIGDTTDYYAQAYFAYDSKKSGGVTRSHLRFGKKPIKSPYLVSVADFVSCSLDTYLEKYDMLANLKVGGTFLLNTNKTEEELINFMPNSFKKTLALKKIKFFVVDAITLAREIGLGNRTNTILQSSFFKLNEQIMPYKEAQKLMKEYAYKSYIKKGEKIVELNYQAIDKGAEGLKEIKVLDEWKNLPADPENSKTKLPDFVKKIANPINAIKGYDLPVSTFKDYADGQMVQGTAAYEKRYISPFVPKWKVENCIQCNQCAFVCPHAVIRPFLLNEEDLKKAPKTLDHKKALGPNLQEYEYTIQISIADCTGCGNCVERCPGMRGEKALQMVNLDEEINRGKDKEALYAFDNFKYRTDLVDIFQNPKNSQFAQPLFEFSGACAGCGETPYVKLVTQLFGDRMLITNATGCSSIYGGSYPTTPYTVNKEGFGPAWANSLFEDNAEFGFGMHMANETIRIRLMKYFLEVIESTQNEELKVNLQLWIDNKNSGKETRRLYPLIVEGLKKEKSSSAKEALKLEDYIVKRSQWIFGGDGWAYDIGYGGLDHVIANQEDVNILVLDTEVYSNTGGQSSKSSPYASIAKFTASGKKGKKKDLAAIAMSYGHVYVASIAHGANQAQMLRAIKEAESYDGPSLIIAYSPCIAHGLKNGMGFSQLEAKLAVDCGYWNLFRYDPRLEKEGKNPFQLDSREPNWDLYNDFLMSERRYAQLKSINPEHADNLLKHNKEDAQRRYKMYKRYLAMDYSLPEASTEK